MPALTLAAVHVLNQQDDAFEWHLLLRDGREYVLRAESQEELNLWLFGFHQCFVTSVVGNLLRKNVRSLLRADCEPTRGLTLPPCPMRYRALLSHQVRMRGPLNPTMTGSAVLRAQPLVAPPPVLQPAFCPDLSQLPGPSGCRCPCPRRGPQATGAAVGVALPSASHRSLMVD